VKVVKRCGSDGGANQRADRFACVACKVWHREEHCGGVVVALCHLKVPVVGELEREARVVARLDNDHVGHKVGTEQQRQRFDLVGLLRHAAREREHGELLLGLEHDQIGAKDDARRVTLVVVDLHGRVVRRAVRDDARRIARTKLDAAIVAALLLEQLLDDRRQSLHIQLLVRLQQIGFADHRRHFARLEIAHVDALVLIERNRFALL
jgi:hypothetical protein